MQEDLMKVIELVGKDKGIDKTLIIEALEAAMLYVARVKYGNEADIEAIFNEEMNEIEVFQFRKVVENVNDESLEISIEEAKKRDPESALDDDLGVKLDTAGFTRVAAQAAKQILVQKVRNAEKDVIYEEFKDRKGELISGIIRRFERQDIIVDLGRTEAILPYKEQVPNEKYRIKDRVQCHVLDVKRVTKGPQIILSRANEGLLIRLFEIEVSEIYDGIVTIKNGVRDPGFRSKISVYSKESSVDPVGACVGIKGSRVQNVVQELKGEKIDIVPWDPDPAKYVCNSLAPAEVSKVIVNEKTKTMEVIVPDDQLSLAIGKRGQNVRLAARLTMWKIDIKSESKLEEGKQLSKEELLHIEGLNDIFASILVNEGFRKIEEVAKMTPRIFLKLLHLEEEQSTKIINNAKKLVEERENNSPEAILGRELTTDDKLLLNISDNIDIPLLKKLNDIGYYTLNHLSSANAESLSEKLDIPLKTATDLIEQASNIGV